MFCDHRIFISDWVVCCNDEAMLPGHTAVRNPFVKLGRRYMIQVWPPDAKAFYLIHPPIDALDTDLSFSFRRSEKRGVFGVLLPE